MRSLFSAFASLALLVLVTLGSAETRATDLDPIPFIDAHVHLNDERMQLELMQRHGAERAVVFWGRNSDNESVAASAKRHPDRFIPFASVSPERATYRRGWEQDDPGLLETLDAMLATGLYKGIGEISVTHFPSPGLPEADFNPNGATLRGILALARKHQVPVMVHAEWTRLREFSELLRSFPDVPVIWAHGGYTPLFMAQRVLDQHPNLIYELSARTWPVHPRSPEYTLLRDGQNVWPQWLAFIESQPERFLVGTDASHRSADSEAMKFQSVQNFLRQLSPAARDLVARKNLLKLLNMSP
jgi:predicted TIM-barrel fold metal-dependent hydrolase